MLHTLKGLGNHSLEVCGIAKLPVELLQQTFDVLIASGGGESTLSALRVYTIDGVQLFVIASTIQDNISQTGMSKS